MPVLPDLTPPAPAFKPQSLAPDIKREQRLPACAGKGRMPVVLVESVGKGASEKP